MSDKPFDPVTEGTPDEFDAVQVNLYWTERVVLIAARDAAMRNLGRLDMMQDYGVTEEPEVIALARTWTPEQLFQQWENAFYAVRILTEEITREREHRASAERRGRLKGLEEAAEIVDDLDVPCEKACWNYTDGFKDGRHMAEQAIRAAAETVKEGGDV